MVKLRLGLGIIALAPVTHKIGQSHTLALPLLSSTFDRRQKSVDFVFLLLARHSANVFALCPCFVRRLTSSSSVTTRHNPSKLGFCSRCSIG